MNSSLFLSLVCSVAVSTSAVARIYVPLGEAGPSRPVSRSIFLPVKPEARPFLPGLRPVGLELLEDALRRKQPHTIGNSTAKAHDSIIRNWLRSPTKRAHMKGILAEALFLERNPQWGYVSSPNASQHDLYSWLPGRKTPFTAQVKTHSKPNPSVYARDMVKDHRSNLFLVPDDHVAGLKDYWRDEIKDLKSRGLAQDAAQATKQMARVRGIGFSTAHLDANFTKDAHYVLRERQASYISMGAALAMAFGPDLWEWARTGSLHPQATSRWVRSGTVLSTASAATYSLKHIAKGSWRGGWKGNALVGSVMVLTDGYFTVQEYGGVQDAFTNANFYCRMSGSIGGATLAFVVGEPVAIWATGAAAETGPFAPVIGGAVGLLFASGAYVVGSVVSDSSLRTIFETIKPELLHEAEKKMVSQIQNDLTAKISSIRSGRPPAR